VDDALDFLSHDHFAVDGQLRLVQGVPHLGDHSLQPLGFLEQENVHRGSPPVRPVSATSLCSHPPHTTPAAAPAAPSPCRTRCPPSYGPRCRSRHLSAAFPSACRTAHSVTPP